VRDPEGLYSAEEPFWAPLAGARYLTTPGSDRVVLPSTSIPLLLCSCHLLIGHPSSCALPLGHSDSAVPIVIV
jgi:hypothetical protein